MSHLQQSNPFRTRGGNRKSPRRASVVVVVLWAVALGAIITTSVQLSGQRQALLGTEAIARVQARWAARAGVERTISILSYYTQYPDPDNALRIYEEMRYVAYLTDDTLLGATYAIEHYDEGVMLAGPFDEHKKLNVNFTLDRSDLLENAGIDPATADAIIDWIDDDDEPRPEGVEAAWYLTDRYPYKPRNGYMRSIAEVELVAGADALLVRGEDWNLNNRFDPNENDGYVTPPDDNADGYLHAGWSKYLTAHSIAGGLGTSGLPRLYLPEATPEQVQERTGVSINQAEALVNFGSNPNNTMAMLWEAQLPYIREDGTIQSFDQGFANQDVLPLDIHQYAAVFSELTMDDPSFRYPGRININTVSAEVLRDVVGIDPIIAEEIIAFRNSQQNGIVSLGHLVQIPQMQAPTLADLAEVADVSSNVFTITAIGRSENTGTEVQLVVVVDRSSLPIHILEYREQ